MLDTAPIDVTAFRQKYTENPVDYKKELREKFPSVRYKKRTEIVQSKFSICGMNR